MKIRGVNLGGWLLMEGYILGGRNIAESEMKRVFAAMNGQDALEEFEKAFRDNFITKSDFANIRKMGATAVRLPFNHRLVEPRPYEYSEEGFSYIDNALSWAEENRLGVILDLHAAPGAQNFDWHSDSCGNAQLWDQEDYRRRTCSLWAKIADRYRNRAGLIGYDVLNEPVLPAGRVPELREFYREIIRSIRLSDKVKKIYLEGNIWSQQIDFLKDLAGDNVDISIHTYCPLNFTFNFVPCLSYPGKIEGESWHAAKMRAYLRGYRDFARRHSAGMFVGEFGINWRGGFFGELKWLDHILKVYDEYGFDYTYWTYKAVAGSVFPDGIYQYFGNNAYVRREGPVYGFENYAARWKKEKRAIADFFRTSHYTPNKKIIAVLKKHFTEIKET